MITYITNLVYFLHFKIYLKKYHLLYFLKLLRGIKFLPSKKNCLKRSKKPAKSALSAGPGDCFVLDPALGAALLTAAVVVVVTEEPFSVRSQALSSSQAHTYIFFENHNFFVKVTWKFYQWIKIMEQQNHQNFYCDPTTTNQNHYYYHHNHLQPQQSQENLSWCRKR